VTEQALQFERIYTVSQKIDGKRVAKAVGMSTGNAGAISEATDEAQETGSRERPPSAAGEDERVRGERIGAGGEIAPESLGGRRGDGQNPPFVALAHHSHVAVALVEIPDEEAGSAFARFCTDL
jgi:hypothetical protein